MKTDMQNTSLISWQQKQPTLKGSQQKVYLILQEATKNGFDMLDYETAKALHAPINTVTPRRGELVNAGLVFKTRRRVNPSTGRLSWGFKTRIVKT
jgi:hypothetical protein